MAYLEIFGFITGVAGVWLTMRQHILCFPVGLINVIISLFLFYGQLLYADALQQIVYIILISYGWYKWMKGTDKQSSFPVTRLTLSTATGLLILTGISTIVLAYILNRFTNATYPWFDSFATSTAFAAQYLVARKKIENWYLWIVVNVSYILIYFQKELYLYIALFIIYLFLSFAGLYSWRKDLQTIKSNPAQ